MSATYFEVVQKRNQIGRIENITYNLIGTSPYVDIAFDVVEDFGYSLDEPIIKIGPYQLFFVASNPYNRTIQYVRSDKFGKLRVLIYKVTRGLDLVYRRLIITLSVWNLAFYNPRIIPSWRDIKLLNWKNRNKR